MHHLTIRDLASPSHAPICALLLLSGLIFDQQAENIISTACSCIQTSSQCTSTTTKVRPFEHSHEEFQLTYAIIDCNIDTIGDDDDDDFESLHHSVYDQLNNILHIYDDD